ncbi:MAG: hypothetical protein NTZ05_21375 [Chloroflexi bacterium]|nr:hypothetical protein [Chloroflexota bacterium]
MLLGIAAAAELAQLPELRAGLPPTGALWVIYPKGVKAVTEGDVLTAGRAAGLTDVKVAAFSPSHTALRFVIPRAARTPSQDRRRQVP